VIDASADAFAVAVMVGNADAGKIQTTAPQPGYQVGKVAASGFAVAMLTRQRTAKRSM
jgi:hypothetical protein